MKSISVVFAGRLAVLALAVVCVSCATEPLKLYSHPASETTAVVTIEDVYIPQFSLERSLTQYTDWIAIYSSEEPVCPYLMSDSSGYQGLIVLSTAPGGSLQAVINLETDTPVYLDFRRKWREYEVVDFCEISARVELEQGKQYNLAFDGKKCDASLYLQDDVSGNLEPYPMIVSDFQDVQLCDQE